MLIVMTALSLAPSSYGKDDGDEDAPNGDDVAIRRCLKAWETHPFKGTELPRYRVLKPAVKVLGIGKDVVDDKETDKPQLVLVKPSVNVLTKNSLELLNPNGWYCFKANVTVLGKLAIKAHCKASLASSKDGAVVLGSGDEAPESVTVLGKTAVKRVGCRKSAEREKNSEGEQGSEAGKAADRESGT